MAPEQTLKLPYSNTEHKGIKIYKNLRTVFLRLLEPKTLLVDIVL